MNDRADVPVFTGIPVNRNASTQKAVLAIAAAINSDSFWLAQAAQINWIPGNRFEIYPAFGDHVIEFGNADNATNKLMRLKLFYEQVSVRKGFDAYPKISVAYSRQVLAIKPDSGKTTIDAQKALQVFDQMVKSNRLTATVDKDDDHDPAPAVATATVDKSGSVDDHPPDEKNQEEKTTAASKQPKAVMPKRNSN
jgi:hypothetical protein